MLRQRFTFSLSQTLVPALVGGIISFETMTLVTVHLEHPFFSSVLATQITPEQVVAIQPTVRLLCTTVPAFLATRAFPTPSYRPSQKISVIVPVRSTLQI